MHHQDNSESSSKISSSSSAFALLGPPRAPAASAEEESRRRANSSNGNNNNSSRNDDNSSGGGGRTDRSFRRAPEVLELKIDDAPDRVVLVHPTTFKGQQEVHSATTPLQQQQHKGVVVELNEEKEIGDDVAPAVVHAAKAAAAGTAANQSQSLSAAAAAAARTWQQQQQQCRHRPSTTTVTKRKKCQFLLLALVLSLKVWTADAFLFGLVCDIPLLGWLFQFLFPFLCQTGPTEPTEQAKLTASDGAGGGPFGSWFGTSLAMDGDTLVIGASRDDCSNGDLGCGSVYVYTRSGTVWTEQAKLTESDGASDNGFGSSLAMDGDTLVIGTVGGDCSNGESGCGSAYVYTRTGDGTVWTKQAKLISGFSYDGFGTTVALDGDTIVIGAFLGEIDRFGGRAYVYTRSGTVWTEQAKLSDGAAEDGFGSSVAINGDTFVVGANWDDENGQTSGSAYVYTRSGTGTAWTKQAKLTASDGACDDQLGRMVAMDGDTIVVGVYWDDTENGIDSGSAYVYTHSNTGSAWTEQAKLTASDGAEEDQFGISVAIHGSTIVIGAYGDDCSNGDLGCGSAYVYTRSGTVWKEQAKLTASDGFEGDVLGTSVAIDGDTIVIGAPGDDDNGSLSGSAYVFE